MSRATEAKPTSLPYVEPLDPQTAPEMSSAEGDAAGPLSILSDWESLATAKGKGCAAMFAFAEDGIEAHELTPVFFSGVGVSQHAETIEAKKTTAEFLHEDTHTANWVHNRMLGTHEKLGRMDIKFLSPADDNQNYSSSVTIGDSPGALLPGTMVNRIYMRLTLVDHGVTAVNKEPLVLRSRPELISAETIADDPRVKRDPEGLPEAMKRILRGAADERPFYLVGQHKQENPISFYSENDPERLIGHMIGGDVCSSHHYGLEIDLLGSELRNENTLWANVRISNLTMVEQNVHISSRGLGRMAHASTPADVPVELAPRGGHGSSATFEMEVTLPRGTRVSDLDARDCVSISASNVPTERIDQISGQVMVGVSRSSSKTSG